MDKMMQLNYIKMLTFDEIQYKISKNNYLNYLKFLFNLE